MSANVVYKQPNGYSSRAHVLHTWAEKYAHCPAIILYALAVPNADNDAGIIGTGLLAAFLYGTIKFLISVPSKIIPAHKGVPY